MIAVFLFLGKTLSQENNYDAVNAVIDDNYIVPGMYGRRINEVKSLMNMKATGVFNSLFNGISKVLNILAEGNFDVNKETKT